MDYIVLLVIMTITGYQAEYDHEPIYTYVNDGSPSRQMVMSDCVDAAYDINLNTTDEVGSLVAFCQPLTGIE